MPLPSFQMFLITSFLIRYPSNLTWSHLLPVPRANFEALFLQGSVVLITVLLIGIGNKDAQLGESAKRLEKKKIQTLDLVPIM